VSTHRWAKPLSLAVVLVAATSHAQGVVVLDFGGDARGKVHAQMEKAFRAEGMSLVQLRKYKREADRRHVRGARTGRPGAVAAMSSAMGLSGVVKGKVRKQVLVATLVDARGREVLTKSVRLVRGTLPGQAAGSLANDVAGALSPKPSFATPPPAPSAPAASPKIEARVEAPPEIKPEVGQTLPELNLSPDTGKKAERRQEAESVVASEAGEVQRVERPQQPRDRIGPKTVTARLTVSPLWRTYCSRPGVSSCKDYDNLPSAQRPAGDTVDFRSQSPYTGVALAAELFPLANFNRWLAGLGLEAGYARGFSTTNVTQGTTTRSVSGSDNAFSALLAYRYYFPLAVVAGPEAGYGGLHFGYSVRDFSVDSSAGTPLLGSKRSYPLAGLEVSIPIASYLRVEALGSFLFGPKAGQAQLSNYGTSVSSSGLELEAGLAGDVWGPFGYVAKFKYAKYSDTFKGAGASWQNGGVAEESYSGIFAGASVSY
jgi:hypothetical protein